MTMPIGSMLTPAPRTDASGDTPPPAPDAAAASAFRDVLAVALGDTPNVRPRARTKEGRAAEAAARRPIQGSRDAARPGVEGATLTPQVREPVVATPYASASDLAPPTGAGFAPSAGSGDDATTHARPTDGEVEPATGRTDPETGAAPAAAAQPGAERVAVAHNTHAAPLCAPAPLPALERAADSVRPTPALEGTGQGAIDLAGVATQMIRHLPVFPLLGDDLTARPISPRFLSADTDVLVPEFRGRLERVIDRMEREFGFTVEVVETVRSQERQDALWAQGRQTDGPIVTWTQASRHTTGLAADVRVNGGWTNREGFERLALVAREEGLRTLGPRDPGHLELPAHVLREGAEAPVSPRAGPGRQRDEPGLRFLPMPVEAGEVRALPILERTIRVPTDPMPPSPPVAWRRPDVVVAATTPTADERPPADGRVRIQPVIPGEVRALPIPGEPDRRARILPVPTSGDEDMFALPFPRDLVGEPNRATRESLVAVDRLTGTALRPQLPAVVAAVAAVAKVATVGVVAPLTRTLRASAPRGGSEARTPRHSDAPRVEAAQRLASEVLAQVMPLGALDDPRTVMPTDRWPAVAEAQAVAEDSETRASSEWPPVDLADIAAAIDAGRTDSGRAMVSEPTGLTGRDNAGSGTRGIERADATERIARALRLQEAAGDRPMTSVLLRLDHPEGGEDRIRIDLRGRTVGATLDIRDLVAADHMRAHTNELHQALERRGLEGEAIVVRTTLEAHQGIAAAAGGERESVRAAVASQGSHHAGGQPREPRTPRDTAHRDHDHDQPASRQRREQGGQRR